jgi:hypothetical protein
MTAFSSSIGGGAARRAEGFAAEPGQLPVPPGGDEFGDGAGQGEQPLGGVQQSPETMTSAASEDGEVRGGGQQLTHSRTTVVAIVTRR